MGIIGITLPKTPDLGTSCELSIELQEIRFTEAQTTTLPDSYGRSGATGVNAGTANTTSTTIPVTGPLDMTDNRTLTLSILNLTGIFD
jgi:hypothetical protein